MASKIKVDTIENVAGSGNVSLGSGHNLVVPGNITGQGTAAITSNATVGGTLGVTGTTTAAAVNTSGVITARSGNGTGVSSASIVSVINSGNSLEWGHGNPAGYRSTLGALSGGGQPFLAFSAEHGTNANTFRTRGLKGHVIQTDNTGGLIFQSLETASADNQTGVTHTTFLNTGQIKHNSGDASDAQMNIRNDEAGGLYRCLNLYTSVTGNRILQTFFNGNGQVGQIITNGSSTAYQTSSDYRLKENVEYNFDATSRVKELKPCRFNFKTDKDTTVDGFLAHEVSSIVPEAIYGEKDGTEKYTDEDGKEQTRDVMQSIDQSKLVPLLVKTIQELEARIAVLEAQ